MTHSDLCRRQSYEDRYISCSESFMIVHKVERLHKSEKTNIVRGPLKRYELSNIEVVHNNNHWNTVSN